MGPATYICPLNNYRPIPKEDMPSMWSNRYNSFFLSMPYPKIQSAVCKLRVGERHHARSNSIPNHMINTTSGVMIEKDVSDKKIPIHAREIYTVQKNIRWWNFLPRRISKKLISARTPDKNELLDINTRWRTNTMRIILQWTHTKWFLRCNMWKEL